MDDVKEFIIGIMVIIAAIIGGICAFAFLLIISPWFWLAIITYLLITKL